MSYCTNTPILLCLLLILMSTVKHSCNAAIDARCIKAERNALLDLKKGLIDPSGKLSSWVVAEDCCKWDGVVCSNTTGHVIALNLPNSHPNDDTNDYGEDYTLSGEVSPSLLDLTELNYLDLSMNNFEGNPIPEFIGSINNLRYLNLSGASFGGTVPQSLGNLSNLMYLDLNSYFNESIENDLKWLLHSRFLSLKYLDLGNVDLSKAADHWLEAINMLPSLSELHLPSCGITTLHFSLPFVNFTSLTVLDLSNNVFNSSIPNWLFNLTSLEYLDLRASNLQGELTDQFGHLASLQYVDLSQNYNIGGKIWNSWGKLCDLRQLDISQNKISGEIIEFIDALSSCPNVAIETLHLEFNKFTGFVPESIGRLKSLEYLYLSENSFTGSIPDSIGNLSSLTILNLSKNKMSKISRSLGKLSSLVALELSQNAWEGVITEDHFSNLSSLLEFFISKTTSTNGTLIFNISSAWIPPFKLRNLGITGCQVGPTFPSWLRTQNELTALTINKAGISDTVPDWFCELKLELSDLGLTQNNLTGRIPNLFKFVDQGYVDLSSNRFVGPFPLFHSNVTLLYLRDNYFSGPIPHDIGTKMPNLANFDVSYNSLTGRIPVSIRKIAPLLNIVLANNDLTGEIPLIWNDKPNLYIVDLSSNRLSGKIPVSMGLLTSLMFLALSNNNLTGEIPSSLQNCTMIQSLDLGENRLSGTIPSWIGEKMPSMLILRVRSNLFTGHIPSELCTLSSLHILDLAENTLSGKIPSCVGNLSGMAFDLTDVRYEGRLLVATKQREFLYDNTLYLVNSIDFSSNRLSGEMPQDLKNLSRLGTLNLSVNHLTGNIPENIGSLQWLETLDLSRNQMYGPIPTSMASLTYLSHLNLSYNNFSGRIPTSNQFQSLTDPSIYMNNAGLCGSPLTTKCSDDPLDDSPGMEGEDDNDDDDNEMIWFYVSFGPGFAVGFWLVCGTLIIKTTWRAAYYKFFYDMRDKLLLALHMSINHFKRKNDARNAPRT